MLSSELDKRLGKAIDYATRLKHEFVTLEHFLFTLCEAPLIIELLEKFDLTPTVIKTELENYIKKNANEKKHHFNRSSGYAGNCFMQQPY